MDEPPQLKNNFQLTLVTFFESLRNKWRICHRQLDIKPEFTVDIVRVVLYYIILLGTDGVMHVESTIITSIEDLPSESRAH